MGVLVSFNEVERQSSEAVDSRGILVREHRIVYRGIADQVRRDAELILNDPLVPQIGSIYRTPEGLLNRAMWLITREPQNDPEDGRIWFVQCRWSSEWPSSLPPNQVGSNPVLPPPVLTRGLEARREVATVDILGQVYANSSDEPYDPPVTIDAYNRVINIELNAQNFDEVAFDRDFLNRTNLAPWRGYPAFVVKIDGASSRSVTEGSLTYDRVNLTLRVKYGLRVVLMEDYGAIVAAGDYKEVWRVVTETPEPEGTVWSGWEPVILDQGFRRIRATHGGLGRPTILITVEGNPVSRPVLLDGLGAPLSERLVTPFNTPRYHKYLAYYSATFADLGI